MEELVKRHPLYGQLAEYDASIDALNLSATIPAAAASGPELARGEKQLNVELDDARKRTEKILHERQDEYAKRESAAISAALAGGSVPGRSTTQIAPPTRSTSRQRFPRPPLPDRNSRAARNNSTSNSMTRASAPRRSYTKSKTNTPSARAPRSPRPSPAAPYPAVRRRKSQPR